MGAMSDAQQHSASDPNDAPAGYQPMSSPSSPYTGSPQSYAAPAAEPMSAADQRLWATLIHVGGILWGFVPPLIGYLVLKDRGEFVRAHSAQALNFQLTMLIGYVVGYLLTFVFVGIFLVLAVWILTIVFGILAAMAANRGQWYRYPMTITFVS